MGSAYRKSYGKMFLCFSLPKNTRKHFSRYEKLRIYLIYLRPLLEYRVDAGDIMHTLSYFSKRVLNL